jgi:hypothetical protein
MMRESRANELGRVLEKGYDIDKELVSKCGYYPVFRFIKFMDKKKGEVVQGQQFVCKDCTMVEPNKKCEHHINLLW